MKRLQITLLALLLNGALIASAQAGNNAVNGLIIGAGSGALIGQAAGRDTESTLVGTAVGGVVGYVIGSELDGNRHIVVHNQRHRPVVRHHRPAPRAFGKPFDSHKYRRDIRHHRPSSDAFGRPFGSHNKYRDRDKVCRKTVKIHNRHGNSKRVMTTICWNKGSYDHDRRYNDHDGRWHRY